MENIVNIPLHIYFSSTVISKVNMRGDAVTLPVHSRLTVGGLASLFRSTQHNPKAQDELTLQGQVQVSFMLLL